MNRVVKMVSLGKAMQPGCVLLQPPDQSVKPRLKGKEHSQEIEAALQALPWRSWPVMGVSPSPDSIRQRLILKGQHAAKDRGHQLADVQGIDRHITGGADHPPLPLGPEGVTAILHQPDLMAIALFRLTDDRLESVDVLGIAKRMRCNDGPRIRLDRYFMTILSMCIRSVLVSEMSRALRKPYAKRIAF